jgi:transposase
MNRKEDNTMQVLYARGSGLDVHMKTVVACVMITQANGRVDKSIRTFATTTAALLALAEWREGLQVTHVAMESTGVFWRPIYTVLEDQFELLLANAHKIKALPGRKTDVRDGEWIADLMRHGLIRPSFIPAKPVRVLRDLMRYRKSLVYQHTQDIHRLHKVLETATIKLTSVVSDVWGRSGQNMIKAIMLGESDVEILSELARGTLRGKLPQLQAALEGRIQAHHRLLLQHLFAHLRFLESAMRACPPGDRRADGALSSSGRPLADTSRGTSGGRDGLCLGGGQRSEPLPSAKHFASWIGVCPGKHKSRGKHKHGKTSKGNVYLRALLAEIVWGMSHTKDTYVSAQYHRLARRIGKTKAIVAVSHTVAVNFYHMITKQVPYQEPGANYFDTLDRERLTKHTVKRLEALGYEVTLTSKEGSI